jgi:hypothetical protein
MAPASLDFYRWTSIGKMDPKILRSSRAPENNSTIGSWRQEEAWPQRWRRGTRALEEILGVRNGNETFAGFNLISIWG